VDNEWKIKNERIEEKNKQKIRRKLNTGEDKMKKVWVS